MPNRVDEVMWRVGMFVLMALAFGASAGWYTFLVQDVGGVSEDPANTWAMIFSFALTAACILGAIVACRKHFLEKHEFQVL